MKRTLPLAILAPPLLGMAVDVPLRAPGRVPAQEGVAMRARELVSLRSGTAGRFCPGARNAVRLVVLADGAQPGRPVPVQLHLVLPGAPGTLLAEGSVTFEPGARQATFTFLNVEVPVRLRGRSARLVARVNTDRTVPEREIGDNTIALELDAATDWGCAG